MSEYASQMNQSAKKRVEENIRIYTARIVNQVLDFIETRDPETGIKLVRATYADKAAASYLVVKALEKLGNLDGYEWATNAIPLDVLWGDIEDDDPGALHGTSAEILEGFEDLPGDRIVVGEAVGTLSLDGTFIIPHDAAVWATTLTNALFKDH